MKFIRQYKGQLLFTLILFVVILMMPFQDYTERTILVEEMNYSEEAIGYVQTGDGILSVPDGLGEIIFHTDNLYFKKGSYEVTFNTPAASSGSYVEIYDPLYLNPDNTSGRVIASAELPASGDNVTLTFTIEEYVQCVQFRIRSNCALEFHSIYLLSERGLYCDPYIYAGMFLLASALLLLYRTRRRIRPEVLVLLAFAAVWSSLPLCYTWLLNGHDMYFHYGRLFNLSDSLMQGQFPVRIHSRMYRGYGYLTSIFYPEFFLYPFAVLGILGMSPIGCYKMLLICVNFATAGVSYYSFSRLLKSRRIGLIASFLYTLSMYRLINLFTRAAIGEVLATLFLPLLMLGMYQLFIGDSRKWLTAVLAFTGLLQSHMITTELSVAFGVVFALCFFRNLKEKGRLLHIVSAAVSTVLLNLWFLIPMLDHMRYSVYALGDTRQLSGYSLFAVQLFDVGVNNPAAMAEGPNTISPEMPYSVGVVLLIGSLLFLLTCLQSHRKDKRTRLGIYCLVMGVLALYASSSFFPWDAVQRIELLNRLAGSIQFAARFLPFATLFLCVVSALGIYGFFAGREQKQMLFLLCAVLTIYSSGSYFSNFTEQAEAFVTKETQLDHSQDTDDMYLIDNNGERFSVRRMLLQDTSFEPSEGVTLTDCYREGTNAGFTYAKSSGSSQAYVDVSFNYYPDYHACDEDGNELETSLNELLRLRIFLPEAASGTITVHFKLPGFYRISDSVSLLTAILLAALLLVSRRKSRSLDILVKNGAEN